MKQSLPYVRVCRADGRLDVIPFDEIRAGDLFTVNGNGHVCEEEPHHCGDASYDGMLLYDSDGNSWFPEDLDRWEDY